jgi:hypothetical protein
MWINYISRSNYGWRRRAWRSRGVKAFDDGGRDVKGPVICGRIHTRLLTSCPLCKASDFIQVSRSESSNLLGRSARSHSRRFDLLWFKKLSNYAMKTYGGVDICIHLFLTLTLAGLPQGKSPQYPLNRRLGGPQNESGERGEKKNIALTGTRTLTPRPSSPQPDPVPPVLYLFKISFKRWCLVVFYSVLWSADLVVCFACVNQQSVHVGLHLKRRTGQEACFVYLKEQINQIFWE